MVDRLTRLLCVLPPSIALPRRGVSRRRGARRRGSGHPRGLRARTGSRTTGAAGRVFRLRGSWIVAGGWARGGRLRAPSGCARRLGLAGTGRTAGGFACGGFRRTRIGVRVRRISRVGGVGIRRCRAGGGMAAVVVVRFRWCGALRSDGYEQRVLGLGRRFVRSFAVRGSVRSIRSRGAGVTRRTGQQGQREQQRGGQPDAAPGPGAQAVQYDGRRGQRPAARLPPRPAGWRPTGRAHRSPSRARPRARCPADRPGRIAGRPRWPHPAVAAGATPHTKPTSAPNPTAAMLGPKALRPSHESSASRTAPTAVPMSAPRPIPSARAAPRTGGAPAGRTG